MGLYAAEKCHYCLNKYWRTNRDNDSDYHVAGCCSWDCFDNLYIKNLIPPYLERVKERMKKIKCQTQM